MKRTEKIEVRVSLEEKQTLSELAKQDGESVSGLIRGLVEKYMALNTASTTRKLPKWQIAAGLIVAAFIGHGLTLIPIHLHERGHQSSRASAPVYMVHGAIDDAAFGVGIQADDSTKEFTLNPESENPVRIKLAFKANSDDGGILKVSVCETGIDAQCEAAFNSQMDIDRIAPSALGHSTESGKPIHIFVQEMA